MSEEVRLDEFAGAVKPARTDDFVDSPAGRIPSDWSTLKVEEVCEMRNGEATDHVDIGEAEFLVYGSNGPIGSCSEANFEGGLIFGRVGAVGEVKRINEPVWVSDNAIQAKVSADINREYIYYYLSSKELSALATKTAQPLLNQSTIGNVTIPNPDIGEQRKIATVLYTVDQAINQTEEIIEQTERVRQGVRQDILTRGVTDVKEVRPPPENSQELYEYTRNWTVPHAWELKQLSEVCSLQVGYAFQSDWYRDNGEVRVLRGANVGYGTPDWSDTKYLKPEKVQEYQEYHLDSGDIIIGMDRPYTSSGFKISRLSKRDIPSLLVQRVGCYKPDDIDRDYLHVVLSDWRYQKQVLRQAQGMDIPHISKTDILRPEIPVPPGPEQERIADVFITLQERVESEGSCRKQLHRLKQGLMQDLLSGEVRTHEKDIEVPEEVLQYG